MSISKATANEIKQIFEKNMLNDLNQFIEKRHCLNVTNSYLMYLFHVVQTAGILTTSVATGYNNEQLIWTGVALNFLATLIHVYEKMNMSIMKKLMNDIKAIKTGVYVDESEMVDVDQKSDTDSRNNNKSQLQDVIV